MVRYYSSAIMKSIPFIPIPEEVISFFKERRKYIHLPERGHGDSRIAVTYDNIKGPSPNPRFPTEFNYAETNPVPYVDKDLQENWLCDKVAKYAICSLFPRMKPREINIERKAYIDGTSSVPIMVEYKTAMSGTRRIFIKKPDANRLIGNFLYRIIRSDEKDGDNNYAFNRCVFVEEGINGTLLASINESLLIPVPEYRKGIIKASVHADFLELAKDVVFPANRIVMKDYSTRLFDFNLLLEGREVNANGNEKRDVLLDFYLTNHFKEFDKGDLEIYFEERRLVAKRAEGDPNFFKIVRQMAKCYDYSYKTFDERAKQFYGAKSLEDFFEKQILEYEKTG